MKLLLGSTVIAAATASFSTFGGFGGNSFSFPSATTFGSSTFGQAATTNFGQAATTDWASVASQPAATTNWASVASQPAATTNWGSFSQPATTNWGSFSAPATASAVFGTTKKKEDNPGFKKGALGKMYPLDYSPMTVSFKTPKDVCSQYQIRKYNLDISNADINALNADISAEEYVPCSVTTDYQGVDSMTYKGAGCRYKGAVGSLLQCLDENTGKPNGSCRKLSLKVDANEFRDDSQKIDGMKRLNFHGMAVDKALMSERLAYNLMRAAGVAAPCATHIEVYINGKFDGLYVLVQNVAEVSFTSEHFANDMNLGKGAVYKDYWFRPEQNNDEFIKKHHKSGKKEHDFVKEATNALMRASETDCTLMEKYFDLDTFATVTAVNDYIGQVDDWRMRHNFFWYIKDDGFSKKFVMIPWDYDRLDDDGGGLQFRRNKAGTWWRSTNFNYNSQECLNPQADGSVAGAAYARGIRKTILDRKIANLPVDSGSPIECDKITRMFANCAYDKVKSRFAQVKARFTNAEINKKLDAVTSQIQAVVNKDSSMPWYEWKQGIQSLKQFLRTAPQYAPTKGRMPQQQTGMGGIQIGGMGMQMGGLGGMMGGLGGMMGGFGFGR